VEHASIIGRDIVGVKKDAFLYCEGVSIWSCMCINLGSAHVS
jgi:hypothetical protein